MTEDVFVMSYIFQKSLSRAERVRVAEWSKAPDSSSGPRERAWVQIPLLTFSFFNFSAEIKNDICTSPQSSSYHIYFLDLQAPIHKPFDPNLKKAGQSVQKTYGRAYR
ncbi:hypothetical protein HAX54_005402 [Datura stramonium]|uniref:Uncharacterized protein n=1 Tax=Datura stramonium TaxID=4076 RepID=A0ABS8T9F5_DATST|nr:hypothetical protein [Datura stramonium]